MTDIAATVSELAELWPALAAARERDAGGEGGAAGHAWMAALVVNADVLTAMLALDRDVPAAVRRACEAVSEPWRHRDVAGCLLQVPRLAGRLHDLGMVRDESDLTWEAGGWLRMVKRALGLRRPDTGIGYDCPYAADFPELHRAGTALLAVGDEGFLRYADSSYRVAWVHTPAIRCASADCGAEWDQTQWERLGVLLGTDMAAT